MRNGQRATNAFRAGALLAREAEDAAARALKREDAMRDCARSSPLAARVSRISPPQTIAN